MTGDWSPLILSTSTAAMRGSLTIGHRVSPDAPQTLKQPHGVKDIIEVHS